MPAPTIRPAADPLDDIDRDTGGADTTMARQDQADLSPYFAGFWKGEEPPHFDMIPWHDTARLDGCLASVCCELTEMLEGGDHWIVTGRAIDVWIDDEPVDPLIFFGGKYREIAIPGRQ